MPSQAIIDNLFKRNALWMDKVNEEEPTFLPTLDKGQSPKVLWIGCADSRAPESVVTASRPGDIFVHRNIANQFHPEDDSANAILTYAIETVGCEHVAIVGHTQCGGALACLHAAGSAPATAPSGPTGALSRWLAPLTKLATSLQLSGKPHHDALTTLIEENVRVQVENVCASAPIGEAWASGKGVAVHGWIYEVGTGKLRDLGITRTAA
ncbi:carbonic anhydrase [Coniophora puteana RWD-64-598 SS2]|uniref:Carbonic anhydrase n=1 Tax=Coniophora puteana (strain RWD-64-598) TaxID=741705 RepID=A0A5M3MDF9_CONPW|nr:carbonic anhydrase [Coniophora puteana RWD-64-598 SS2]EIW76874.1 carbonic anhydrase [Coniophora puteana RWD-64-598 SS2]